jgi:hypothetical protein
MPGRRDAGASRFRRDLQKDVRQIARRCQLSNQFHVTDSRSEKKPGDSTVQRRIHLNSIALTFTALIALSAAHAEAQVKPFKISGEGVGPAGLPLPGQPARPHWIVGNATHLGRHEGEGSVQTDSAEIHVDPETGMPTRITGEFGSGTPFVFVAANGDELACHYGRTDFGAAEPGSFELTVVDVLGFQGGQPILLVEAVWLAEFVPQPDLCTGRFAGISGSWTMLAWSEPFVLGSDDPVFYAWEGAGKLKFAR